MDEQPVRDLAGELAHSCAHRCEPDRDRIVVPRRRERRRHEDVRVVARAVAQRRTRPPRLPDRAQRRDEVPHACDRRAVRHGVALLHVRLHLAAEPEDEAPVRRVGELPCRLCDRHRAAAEGDEDPGADLDAARRAGCNRACEQGVARELARPEAAEAEPFRLLRRRRHGAERRFEDRIEPHAAMLRRVSIGARRSDYAVAPQVAQCTTPTRRGDEQLEHGATTVRPQPSQCGPRSRTG